MAMIDHPFVVQCKSAEFDVLYAERVDSLDVVQPTRNNEKYFLTPLPLNVVNGQNLRFSEFAGMVQLQHRHRRHHQRLRLRESW